MGLCISLAWVQAEAFQENAGPSSHLLAQAPADKNGVPAKGQAAPRPRQERLRGFLQQIGLSPQQWEQLRNISAASRSKIAALRQTIRTLSRKPQTPEAAAQLAKARQDLAKTQAQMRQDVMAVLTPDQWTRLQQIRPQGAL